MRGRRTVAGLVGVVAVTALLASGCVLNGTWTAVTPFDPVPATQTHVNDVACLSATDCLVVGFEAAPEVEHLLRPVTDARKAQLDSRRRISLAGKTVREALDTIVAIDPRYRWVDVHGVPIVRPWASWVDCTQATSSTSLPGATFTWT